MMRIAPPLPRKQPRPRPRKPFSITLLKLGAIIGCAATCASGTVLAEAASGTTQISEDQIVITLPMFVVSLVATNTFVWAISRWERRHAKEMAAMRERIKELERLTHGEVTRTQDDE